MGPNRFSKRGKEGGREGREREEDYLGWGCGAWGESEGREGGREEKIHRCRDYLPKK